MTPRKSFPAAIFACAALVLGACRMGAGPAATIAAFNPMTMDPRALRTAVRMPQAIRVTGGELIVSVTLPGKAPEVRHFPLVASRDPTERISLSPQTKVGFEITVFRLDQAQAAALAAWRAQMASPEHGKLTLSVNADACRIIGKGGDPVPMTIYIAAEPTGGYHALTAETDLVRVAHDMGRPFALAPCAMGT